MAATKKATPSKEAKKAPAKRKVKRASAPLTQSQARVLEAQFDTRLNDLRKLDEKLAEIEAKFDDENKTLVPTQVRAARSKIDEAIKVLDYAREDFAEIGTAMRSFFG